VGTGIGIWLEKSWALAASITIVALTILVFGAFQIHVFYGGEYAQRTVVAMSLRTLVWTTITFVSWRRWVARNI
jgi:hypothetical protein